jgi:hypothetical protein
MHSILHQNTIQLFVSRAWCGTPGWKIFRIQLHYNLWLHFPRNLLRLLFRISCNLRRFSARSFEQVTLNCQADMRLFFPTWHQRYVHVKYMGNVCWTGWYVSTCKIFNFHVAETSKENRDFSFFLAKNSKYFYSKEMPVSF